MRGRGLDIVAASKNRKTTRQRETQTDGERTGVKSSDTDFVRAPDTRVLTRTEADRVCGNGAVRRHFHREDGAETLREGGGRKGGGEGGKGGGGGGEKGKGRR